jgi:crossover junction endodeoxyribonuclease RusA
MNFTVKMPWPQKELSPNWRGHWTKLGKTKAAYRQACYVTAKSDGVTKTAAKAAHLTITFYPPDKRGRDLDNMLASIKSGLDGLADAMGMDDRHWTLTLAVADSIGGYVHISINPMD